MAEWRSDQKLDPRCEPCFDTEKRMVDVSIFCNECYQFMCSDCQYYHDKLPFTKNHDVLQGSRMPKSLADKPPKYEGYDKKPEQRMVCDNQKSLLRSACSGSDLESRLIHTKSTGEVAKTDKHPQSDALSDPMKNVNDKAYSLKVSIENDLGELEKLLEETRNFHGKVSARLNELYQVIQSETEAIETLSRNKQHKDVKMKEQTKQAAEIQNANQPSPTCANPFDEMGDSEAPDPLSHIKATKQNQYDTCSADMVFITGMAVTKDSRRLLVDHDQCQVKVFSPEMKYLSCVSLPDVPTDIAVIDDNSAIVTTNNMTLVILTTSWRYWSYWMYGRQISINKTVKLHFTAAGICRYKDKLIVTCPSTKPPCVKLIDQTGREYWTVYNGRHGRKLFGEPLYVCCKDDGEASTVVVTDKGNKKLFLLNALDGQVVKVRQLDGNKRPRGVTADKDDNVYVCNYRTNEITVFTGDLTEERPLLTAQEGLESCPYAIAYDESAGQLIVSHFLSNKVHCFLLSNE